jgi:hypothetical protein
MRLIKLYFTISLFALTLFGQNINQIKAKCPNPNQRIYQSIVLGLDGAASLSVCPNNDFLVSNLNGAAKFQDVNYIPFRGSLNADVFFSNASNDNNQNAAPLVSTTNHFVGFANDLKVGVSGASKFYFGQLNQIRLSGNITGTPTIYGLYNFTNNRGLLGGLPYVYGIENNINLEGNATESVGIDSTSYKGSAVTCPLLIGGRFTAGGGYTNTDFLTGVEAIVRTVSSGQTTTLGRSFFARFQVTSGHTIVNAYGNFIGEWTNGGTIQNTAAIKIDNTTNIGTISNFAIASDSTADSYFAGNLKANSGFYLYDSATATVKQVTLGANDSCGAGFKCLKVAN